MRFFTARRLALAAFFPVLLTFTVIPGCSKEGEGERCGGDDDKVHDDSDCEDGLKCMEIDQGVLRCCNPTHVTTSRCVPVITAVAGAPNSTGTSAGAAGISGAATGGSSGSGTSNAGSPSSADPGAAGESSTEAGAGDGT